MVILTLTVQKFLKYGRLIHTIIFFHEYKIVPDYHERADQKVGAMIYKMSDTKHFTLQKIGPIRDVSIDFGDLTFLVGPQASGKSICLEMYKLLVDKNHILSTLRKYNYIVDKYDPSNVIGTYFGEGMETIIKDDTAAGIDDNVFSGTAIKAMLRTTPGSSSKETVFYIPAQRIFSIDDGRPKNFMEFDVSSPYILRNFSELLRIFIQGGLGNPDVIFPMKNRLKEQTKAAINRSIFHNSKVIIDKKTGQRKMKMTVDDMLIPFMSWSAGQKEFLPLLLSFYCLNSTPNMIKNQNEYDTVIIEEPEMGLHPKAIVAVIMEILDLINAGYKVIVSTHSAVFIEFAWAFNNFKENSYRLFRNSVANLLDVDRNSTVADMLGNLYKKNIKTYYFKQDINTGKSISVDISSLDVGDENDIISDWGGLSWFSSRVADVVMHNAQED